MKVKAVRRRTHDGQVYNIATPPNENYFANGILVHNCYQGSTRQGQHAPFDVFDNLARALKELRVFECALGGGETTAHPRFVDILRAFRKQGVIPNFTTYSLAWLKDPKVWIPIIREAGSFAVSCDCAAKVLKLAERLKQNGLLIRRQGFVPDERAVANCRVSVQYVLGTSTVAELEALLRAADQCALQVTLLGYKQDGRGSQYTPHPTEGVWEMVTRLRDEGDLPSLAIDTALAAEWLPHLQEAGIPSWMYHVEEGRFSCYIDAVASTIAPASYGDRSLQQPLDLTRWSLEEAIQRAFVTF